MTRTRDEILRDISLSHAEAGKLIGVGSEAVRRARLNAGIAYPWYSEKRHWTKPERQRMLDLYAQGKSYRQIAEILGRTHSAIRSMAERQKLTSPTGAIMTVEEIDQCERLFLDCHANINDLCEKFGRTPSTIRRHLRRRGAL